MAVDPGASSYVDEFTKSFTELAEKGQHAFQEFLKHQQDNLEFNMQQLPHIWGEFAKKALENPEKVMSAQMAYWQDYFTICQQFTSNVTNAVKTAPITPPKQEDKRFKDEEWQSNLLFDFIKESYLLTTKHARSLIKEVVDESDPKLAKKLDFYVRQFMDAFSPANFVNTNPEVLRTILETGGQNLLQGLKHFLHDLDESKGMLKIQMTDDAYFEIGKNIAVTPGKVIYQNDVMQLIQYEPTTKQVYQNPLLVVPPWINKFYILDLKAENSLVQWLVDQGHTVFMISWINPTQQKNNKTFEDYLLQGPLAAFNAIEQAVGKQPINVMGYCVGGTLLGCTLAAMAAKRDRRINSATFLATLLDFSDPGEIGVFIDEEQVSSLEKHMQKTGYLDGTVMFAAFNSLRANELIWSYFVNNFLKGNKPMPFDLLYWNSDNTNIPEKLHSYYLREMYLHNRLVQPGTLTMADVALDLTKIKVPAYFLAAKDDHIVPWKTSYRGMQCFTSQTQFVLTGSGHVAGVVNPPQKQKYGYWTNPQKLDNPQAWLEAATYHNGSWWTSWQEWALKYAGELVSARNLKQSPLKPLEDAPGSYVKVRLVDVLENIQ